MPTRARQCAARSRAMVLRSLGDMALFVITPRALRMVRAIILRLFSIPVIIAIPSGYGYCIGDTLNGPWGVLAIR